MAELVDIDQDRLKQHYEDKTVLIFDKYAQQLDAAIAEAYVANPDTIEETKQLKKYMNKMMIVKNMQTPLE